jgi:hypothetical protein
LGEDGVSKNGSNTMPDSESKTSLEAARQVTIISPKTATTIGIWNVHTMFESGKTAQVTQETWNPHRKRRRGRSKITWQRSVESEMKEMSLSWGWLE